MTFTNQSFADLSDDQLLAAVKCLAARECRTTAALVRSLMELDVRKLYLGEGYSSLFTYCTQALHLAEGAAYNRIEAARAARRFPAILTALEDGSVTLTVIRLLAPHLTADNHRDVLASARHKGKREIELLVASLRPMPSVASTIRKVPEPRRALLEPTGEAAPAARTPTPIVATTPIKTPLPAVTALAPERYKVQFTISRETQEKLRRVQALARHAIPSGDPAEIFDRALTLLLQDLERRRCAAVTLPRAPRETGGGSRRIPASVKPCGGVMRAAARISAGRGVARNAASWSITTCSPTLLAGRRRRATSSCDAARTTPMKRHCCSPPSIRTG